MIAASVVVGAGFVVGQAAENKKVVLKWFEWIESRRQAVVCAFALRGPLGDLHAVRNIDKGQTFRWFG